MSNNNKIIDDRFDNVVMSGSNAQVDDLLENMIYEADYGQSRSDWKWGDDVTNTDLMDTYMRYPGADAVVGMMVDAVWHNGFTQPSEETDLTPERRLELIQMDEYRRIFGHSIIVYDEENNLDAWHPFAGAVGFGYIKFNKGIPKEVKVIYDSHYRYAKHENFDKFFHFRTRRGRKGARGRSVLLPVMGVIRQQSDIFNKYSYYADQMGLSYLDISVGGLTPKQKAAIEDDMEKQGSFKYSVHDGDTEVDWKSPMKHSYDPLPILDFADALLSRSTYLNKMHLTGQPEGHLSSSQVGTANWYAKVKEEQDFLLTYLKPLLMRLGFDEDVRFQDPSEYPLEQAMNSIADIRDSLEGLISREGIVEFINRTLGLQGEDKLEAASDAEIKEQLGRDKDDYERDADV